jgi:hypothetical protein
MLSVLCNAGLVFASDTIYVCVMAYVGTVYVRRVDSAGTVNMFCQLYLIM